MRIILIRLGKRLSTNPSVGQPLGIMYLASYLKKYRNNKDEIKLIDMKLKNFSEDKVTEESLRFNPDVIGLSCFSPDAHLLHKISVSLRNSGFKGLIIAGGPHPTADPDNVLKDKNIDIAVLGEGEETFVNLLNSYENTGHFYGVSGTAIRENSDLKILPKDSYIDNLDQIPFPAWELIDFEEYFRYFSNAPLGKRRYMQIFTSRGCPYRCTYCHNVFGKKFRVRSVENVLEEINLLNKKYSINEFEIMDDIFNFDLNRAKKILDGISTLSFEIKLSFPNGLRGDRMDEEFVRKLKDAGTYFVGIAIETGSERLQKQLKKNLKLERVKESIELLNKYGIFTNGFLMFGFPTETKDEMLKTFRFARKSALDIAQVFVLNPFKGTEIYNEVRKTGVKNFDSYDYYTIPYHLNDVPSEEFTRILYLQYFLFYLYKFRFLKTILKYPRKVFLIHYFFLVIKRMLFHIFNRLRSTT